MMRPSQSVFTKSLLLLLGLLSTQNTWAIRTADVKDITTQQALIQQQTGVDDPFVHWHLIIEQVIGLLKYDKGDPISEPVVLEGENISTYIGSSKESMERLGRMLNDRKSDKEHHGYHAFYAGIFDTLIAANAGPIKTLEVGLGTTNQEIVSHMPADGSTGASNRAFRDYLPSTARIYGADVDRGALYQEDRIATAFVDQLESNSFESMTADLGEGSFNLIIDDGLHWLPANLNTLLFGLTHVRKGGWVVIEDLNDLDFWTSFVDVVLRKNRAFRTMLVKVDPTPAYLVQRLE